MNHHFAQNGQDNRTKRLVTTALMTCLIVLGTILFRVPIPMTQGYIHLGDTMIYLGVLLLGRKGGASAAGLGSALADILGGYAFWAPWTLFIKLAMAYAAGLIIDKRPSQGAGNGSPAWQIFGMTIGGIVMCIGYLITERVMYGSWVAAVIALPWNVGQFAVGIAISLIVYHALVRVPYLRELRS
ncbi:MAG: ECF transporter S component [Mogibacterium sp.]|nr:ECF transporter S component [Mogibacterium sp.]